MVHLFRIVASNIRAAVSTARTDKKDIIYLFVMPLQSALCWLPSSVTMETLGGFVQHDA